jgi:hypothetical protein
MTYQKYTQTLDISHPSIAAEWHPTLNGSNKPKHFTQGSGAQIWLA